MSVNISVIAYLNVMYQLAFYLQLHGLEVVVFHQETSAVAIMTDESLAR